MLRTRIFRLLPLRLAGAALLCSLLVVGSAGNVFALGSSQNPQSGSTGLEGKVDGPPPTTPATIAIPSNGQSFSSTPIRVAGSCKTDLLVKIFSNNVFVGSALCTSGSYSLQVDLFSGQNDLVARVYDALDQAGPDSNVIRVTFNDAQFAQFATRVTLSSTYARKGAAPGEVLTWPVTIAGGSAPYAVSIDWGDGKPASLLSRPFAGSFDATHTYDSAGVYTVVMKVTDANGMTAYLQVVGVGTGQVTGKNTTGSAANAPTTKTQILWQPLVVLIPMVLIAFWLGKRHELFVIRKRIEENRNM